MPLADNTSSISGINIANAFWLLKISRQEIRTFRSGSGILLAAISNALGTTVSNLIRLAIVSSIILQGLVLLT